MPFKGPHEINGQAELLYRYDVNLMFPFKLKVYGNIMIVREEDEL